jgi:hypothetical protein
VNDPTDDPPLTARVEIDDSLLDRFTLCLDRCRGNWAPVVAAVARAQALVAVAVIGVARNVAPISAANALRTTGTERVGECREGNIGSLLPRRRHPDYLLIFI